MIIGAIKYCVNCKKESYVRVENFMKCPKCGEPFDILTISNKAPMGWVKKENYEISRSAVNDMINDGTLEEKDIKQWS